MVYICKLLMNYVLRKRIFNILNHVIFPTKIQISKPIDVFVFMILKNISLLDRIWSLWLGRFAHSTTIFIFWLSMLIFSVSINSHPDNIYLLYCWKWHFVLFLLAIVLSVLLWFTDSDYPFGIFKLFLQYMAKAQVYNINWWGTWYITS
jgi:hypothetical protein